jgi:hypothetical protein
MNWHLTLPDTTPSQRDLDRALAARMPFLLAGDCAAMDWARRQQWNVRCASEAGSEWSADELFALAARMDRILVSRDPALLDDRHFPPAASAGLIVVGAIWGGELEEFLVTVVGLLGPFRALYHGVKVEGGSGGTIAITAPAGRHRRVTRRFQLDREGAPLLTAVESSDGRVLAYPGYRRSRSRTAVTA